MTVKSTEIEPGTYVATDERFRLPARTDLQKVAEWQGLTREHAQWEQILVDEDGPEQQAAMQSVHKLVTDYARVQQLLKKRAEMRDLGGALEQAEEWAVDYAHLQQVVQEYARTQEQTEHLKKLATGAAGNVWVQAWMSERGRADDLLKEYARLQELAKEYARAQQMAKESAEMLEKEYARASVAALKLHESMKAYDEWRETARALATTRTTKAQGLWAFIKEWFAGSSPVEAPRSRRLKRFRKGAQRRK